MTNIQIPYGSRLIDVDIEGKLLDVEGVAKSNGNAKNYDVIRHALRNPIGTKKVREIVDTKKSAQIVIVVDDHTRDAPTQKMLEAVTEEIGAEHKINLLVACGTHASPEEEELKRILGEFYTRFEVNIHDCDAKDLVYLGTTSRGTPVTLNRAYVDADIKILTGDISLHYYAGFGGGRKSILPGISSREAIKKNHALLVDEHARTANLCDNPVHQDMTEAASLAPPDFVINTVADASGNLVDAYAGDMNSVFLKGAEVAKGFYLHEISTLFDVLIVSAGGFPKDRNLYQATKAIENCYRTIVPGGELILVAECREGLGDPHFENWMNEYTSYEETEDAIKNNFVLGGHKAFYIRKAMKRVHLSIVSKLNTHMLNGWGIKAYESIWDAFEEKKDKVNIGIVKKGLDTLLVPVTENR